MTTIVMSAYAEGRCRRCGTQTQAQDFYTLKGMFSYHDFTSVDSYGQRYNSSCPAQASEIDMKPMITGMRILPVDAMSGGTEWTPRRTG